MAEPGIEHGGGFQHVGGTVAVLDIGCMDHGIDQEAIGIGQDMAFASLDLLAGVVTARAAGLGRLGRLAVDDPSRGTGLASRRFARHHDQCVIDPLPGTVVAPAIEYPWTVETGGKSFGNRLQAQPAARM